MPTSCNSSNVCFQFLRVRIPSVQRFRHAAWFSQYKGGQGSYGVNSVTQGNFTAGIMGVEI
jgi:hypothetical protein